MPRVHVISCVALLIAAGAASASAQVLQLPERPSRGLFGGGPPPDPDRSRHELGVDWNVLGGYDDNLSPAAGTGQFAFQRGSGYMAFSDAALHYLFGTRERALDVTGRGYVNGYRNVGLTPTYGGQLHAAAHTAVGRTNELRGSGQVSYEPYFTLQSFGLTTDGASPAMADVNAINSLYETRSWAQNANLGFTHRWSRRARWEGTYAYSARTYESGNAFDGWVHAGSASYNVPVSRHWSATNTYRYSHGNFVERSGRERLLDQAGVEAGVEYERALSRTRTLRLTGGAGALHEQGVNETRTEPQPFAHWVPSGYGRLQLDFHRSWAVSADYRRTLSVLQGIVPDSFLADRAAVRLGGYLSRRLEAVLDAGYERARAGYASGGGDTGRYKSYSGAAQLRLELTRAWAAMVAYSRYQYQLNAVAQASLGLLPQMERNAVRVGFTWTQPLFGWSTRSAAPRNTERN